ncbi:hypothetical protein CCR97_03335 [Rhodoplanes elegans]|uniref:Uncharacterized protein n=1 Tax=Rhodoplanes elegans TaxID=29408 RepID=A0A327KC44_9BRAD|nr:hypothetical protein [Rhodoplanes elegans]RAI34922.1 hypothetical protein CH338_20105 [Rhodoplanes elegans]
MGIGPTAAPQIASITIAATVVAATLVAATVVGIAAAGPWPPQGADPDATAKADLGPIATCLASGRDMVMAPRPACVPRGSGAAVAEKAGMPLGERDWSVVCATGDDPRRLPRDAVARLAGDPAVARAGIRIVGALFCDGLDLADLDLSAPLMLDRAVFAGPVDLHNLHLKGDLGLDNAVLLDTLRLDTVRIAGSVRLNRSFVRRLRVADTKVDGSWHQSTAIVFLDAHLVRLAVAGDLQLDRAAVSRLWVRAARVGGTLVLDESEARCAVRIEASTLGALTARDAGFGKVVTIGVGPLATRYPWWRHAIEGRPATHVQTMFRSAAIAAIAEAERRRVALPELPVEENALLRGCREETETLPDGPPRKVGIDGVVAPRRLALVVAETTIASGLCLGPIAWGTPRDGEVPDPYHPATVVGLDGTTIGGTLAVDLWGDDPAVQTVRPGEPAFGRVAALHVFAATGVTTSALALDFSDLDRPWAGRWDGLRFDRLREGRPHCSGDVAARPEAPRTPPQVAEVLRWLDRNQAPSTQPFVPFAAAFQAAGAAAEADELRIRRRSIEVCGRLARWLPLVAGLCPDGAGTAAAAEPSPEMSGGGHVRAGFGGVVSGAGDLIGTGFAAAMWALADHGLRPGKLVWWAMGALAAVWIVLRFGLGVVGFLPERRPAGGRLWPIGPLFLIDRLVPVHRVRREHDAVAGFFRRADAADAEESGDILETTLRGRKIVVRPVDEVTRHRIEIVLTILRVTGVVLAVFLVAALFSSGR